MMSINAVKGFEIGSGFDATRMKGSDHNDLFKMRDGKVQQPPIFQEAYRAGYQMERIFILTWRLNLLQR